MPQKKTKVIREIPENPFIQGQAKRKKATSSRLLPS